MRYSLAKLKPRLNGGKNKMYSQKKKSSHAKKAISESDITIKELAELFFVSPQTISTFITAKVITITGKSGRTVILNKEASIAILNEYLIDGHLTTTTLFTKNRKQIMGRLSNRKKQEMAEAQLKKIELPQYKEGDIESYGGKVTRVSNGFILEKNGETAVFPEKDVILAVHWILKNRFEEMKSGDILEFELQNKYIKKQVEKSPVYRIPGYYALISKQSELNLIDLVDHCIFINFGILHYVKNLF